MTWFRVDDDFHHHPKVMRIPARYRNEACGVWLRAGTWCAGYGTDGFIPSDVIREFDPRERMAARLVDVGLWVEDKRDGQAGYSFHEWLERQPSNAETTARRRRNADRQRRFRERRSGVDNPPPTPHGGADTSDDQPGPATDHPQPDQPDQPGNAARNALRNGGSNSAPTRPDPYPTTSTSVRGVPHDSSGPGSNRPPRCKRHADLPDDDPGPPCVACRDVRLAHSPLALVPTGTTGARVSTTTQRVQAALAYLDPEGD